ncbi:hypothetical protein I317_03977 [Kwoniella heveanensis CBS 569]|nr:hypothetical protein I317_03977 [Kwoniella heveanensis CBS 569]
MRAGLSQRRLTYAVGLFVLSAILFWSDFFTSAISFRESIVPQQPSIPRAAPSIFISQHIPYFTPLYRASYATHLLYAEAWGYGYSADRENYMEGDKRPNAVFMNKMYALKKVLVEQLAQQKDQRYDWVFMTDSDSLISDPAVPLHLLLPSESKSPAPLILGTQDHNGFNSGVMLFRIDIRVLDYINMVIERFHASDVAPSDKPKDWVPSDQVLLAQILVDDPDLAQHFYEIPRFWINAYWIADTEWDPSTPQLQVHLVNHLKRRVSLAPIVRHNLAILEAAAEAKANLDTMSEADQEYGYGHGLDLLPQWNVTLDAGREFWEGAQGGIDGMRWLWD